MAPDRLLSNHWSHILDDLLELITCRLCFEDLIRFSCVCRSWKSFITTNSTSSLLSPKPHLSLIVPHSRTLKTLAFENVYNHRIYKIKTPQLFRHRICGSCFGGWLITTHEDGNVQVFHPFTKTLIRLPNISTFPGIQVTPLSDVDSDYDDENDAVYMRYRTPDDKSSEFYPTLMRDFFLYKVILSSDTRIAMAIYGISKRRLGVCRIGKDETWVGINVQGDADVYGFGDVIFHCGRFYAVDSSGAVFIVLGLDTDSPFIKMIVSSPESCEEDDEYDFEEYCTMYYLVVSLRRELMLIKRIRFIPREEEKKVREYETSVFRVAMLCMKTRKWVRVKNFGNDSSVFVGGNHSFSISNSDLPKPYNGEKNYIFYTDDYMDALLDRRTGGYDVGDFDLTNGTLRSWYGGKWVEPPPVWFTTMST